MYRAHPSLELTTHFARRPYQGAVPAEAKFLFVGLDANYDEGVERSPAFASVLEYHQDGVAFWRRHGVHHPFLLPHYSGDGRRYHRNFARVGFTERQAHLVSFIELLHVPTVGRNKLAPEDLDPSHLQAVSAAIVNGKAKHVFVSAGVVRLMRASRAFPWLNGGASPQGILPELYKQVDRSVYLHLHFSNYGKFQQQLEAEAKAIAALVARDG